MADNINFWEKRYAKDENYRNRFPYSQIVSFLAKNKRPGSQTLLELGCGSGCNLWAAAEFGYDCYGIDVSDTIINYARKFLQDRSVHANLETVSFTDMDFPTEFFDVIIDRSALCCAKLNDHSFIIQKIYEILKPGGLFYFNPPGEVNSSKLLGSSFPVQTIAKDNPYFGTSSTLVYYDEPAILDVLYCFNELEITQNIKYVRDAKGTSHSYSDYEVICEKPTV